MGCLPLTISHLSYADDLLLFVVAVRRNLRNVKIFLTTYEQASGQAINYHKSTVVFSSKIPTRHRTDLLGVLDMGQSSLLIKYLGSYLHKGITRISHCTDLLSYIDRRLQSWQQRLLGVAGRVVLIKSVLSSLPLHLMAGTRLSKSIIKALEARFAQFFQGPSRYHWLSWAKLCLPTQEGGLGVHDLISIQAAYFCKVWHLYHCSDSLWG